VKYQHWIGGPATGSYDDWIAAASEHSGSWWPHWFAWVEKQAPKRVPAREPGAGTLPALEDAPGSYVKMKA
jgi:polyhydroxyalkanoate synthase